MQSAILTVSSARARLNQSGSAFLPTVTPTLRYSDTERSFRTGQPTGAFIDSGSSTDIVTSWRLLDSGERELNFQSTRRLLQAEEFSSLQTVREVLFSVHQQYFEALRAQELLRVADEQVRRAQTIYDFTKANIDAEQLPRKDLLQAEADVLNAKVQQLGARNQVASAEADLKATIGWDQTERLPQLQTVGEPGEATLPGTLEEVMQQGLELRADLEAQRRRIESQRFNVRRTELQAGPQWALDASYQTGFSPDVFQTRGITFLISMPLFDGGFSREAIKEARANYQAAESNLVQFERVARSEIETAYITLEQNAQRVNAAKLAVEAARLNFNAASEAFRLGALGTSLVTVSAAQLTLVTAETNYIQAIYDYYISEVRLRLVTGRPIPGEAQ